MQVWGSSIHDRINATTRVKNDIITAQDTNWRNQDSKSYEHRPRKNNCDASRPHFQSRRRSNNSGLRPDLQAGRWPEHARTSVFGSHDAGRRRETLYGNYTDESEHDDHDHHRNYDRNHHQT